MAGRRREIILGVTGSIASYKACDLTGLLMKKGFGVTPVLTEEAKEFVTPLSLATLSGSRVYGDMFHRPDEWDPVHVSLADKADLILIAPATANIIAKLSHGLCDDLLTCVVLASAAPVVIAPAMNDVMYRHPAVRENIARLERMKYHFVGPVKGRLACGREGIGHLAPLEAIVAAVARRLR